MKNIPVIAISEKTLAEAYEAAIIAVYEKGTRFKTQYDKPEDPNDPPAMIAIASKLAGSVDRSPPPPASVRSWF